MSTRNQTEIFAATESDAWFRRNRGALEKFDADRDPLVRMVRLFGLRPKRILEVGASNGVRVAGLAKELGAEATVVEPSGDAVADGAKRFPHVRYHQGVCHDLPLKDERFDLVMVNYVFSWVDRTVLFRSMAELDRVVEDGGYLIVGDFYAAGHTRVRYHHVETSPVYTYKSDYSAPFADSGIYERIGFASIDHDTGSFRPDVEHRERSMACLLKKSLQTIYSEG